VLAPVFQNLAEEVVEELRDLRGRSRKKQVVELSKALDSITEDVDIDWVLSL